LRGVFLVKIVLYS